MEPTEVKHYLTRRFQFSAAHRLENQELCEADQEAAFAICRNVHGHNYRLEVTLRGEVDPARGFFINVLDLEAVVRELVVDRCEHRFLNDVPLFADAGVVPTTMEHLAARIWAVIEPALASRMVGAGELVEVLLAETDDNIVRLRRE